MTEIDDLIDQERLSRSHFKMNLVFHIGSWYFILICKYEQWVSFLPGQVTGRWENVTCGENFLGHKRDIKVRIITIKTRKLSKKRYAYWGGGGGTAEMAQQAKVLVIKSDNLNSIPSSHTMEGENWLLKAVPESSRTNER